MSFCWARTKREIMTRYRQMGSSAKHKPSERWKEKQMECPAVAPLHWLCCGENTKGYGQTECDTYRQLPTDTRHLCSRVFTRRHVENIALIASVPARYLHRLDGFQECSSWTEYKGVSFTKLFLGQIFNQFSAHGYNPRLHFVPLQPRGIRGNGQSSATPLSPHIAEKLNAFVFLDAKDDIYLKTCGACEWRNTGFCRLIFWRHRYKNSLEASALRRWTGMAEWIHDGTNLLDYMVQLLGFKSTED